MIKMGVGQKDVTNRIQIAKFEVTYTSACVDQDVVVDEHCRSSRPGTDAPAASKNSYTHTVGVLLKLD